MEQGPSGQKAQHCGLVGSPDTIRRKLHKFAESGVDQVILLDQPGRNSHDHICQALELFAARVMPEFHALGADHQEWKRRVLAREVELDEIDTRPFTLRGLQTPTTPAQAESPSPQTAASSVSEPAAQRRA